jgi:hypothetical protein
VTWPWPGETPTERARRIANSLLAALPEDDRQRAITAARAVGETWLGEELLAWTEDDVVTTAQAAELVHVGPSTIRKWHSEGTLPNVGQGRYRVRDVHLADTTRRQQRVAGA